MMDWNGNMTSGGWILSIFAIMIMLALIGIAIAWIARERSQRRDSGTGAAMSAREILDGRLAAGEINADQYEQLRQTLGGRPGPAPRSSRARPADAAG